MIVIFIFPIFLFGYLLGYATGITKQIFSEEIDWIMWGSLAVTASVVVALIATIYPLWKEKRRNDRIADNLRLRLEIALRPLAERLHYKLEMEPSPVVQLDPIYRTYFDAIKTFLPHMGILSDDEIMILNQIDMDLTIFLKVDSEAQSVESTRIVLNNLDACIALLDQRKTLKTGFRTPRV